MKKLTNVAKFFRTVLIAILLLLLCTVAFSQDPLFGYVNLKTQSPQSMNINFSYSGAEYDAYYENHWKITSTNGYMQFTFNVDESYNFQYHVLGSTSGGVSYCYIDVYVNGSIYQSNVFINKNWNWKEIPSSEFTFGTNTVKIVNVGSTHLWITGVNYGYFGDFTVSDPNIDFNYSEAEYDAYYENHWRITSTNGYMEFSFNGNYGFDYHVLGSTSGGVSYCYIDVYVNGSIYQSNVFINKNWNWKEIPSSEFTSGINTVKIVSVGSTYLWLNMIGLFSQGCNDPLEPNDTYSQAYNIGNSTNYSNSNLCLTAGDEDWFKFTYNSSTYYFKVVGYNSSEEGAYGINFSRSGPTVIIETYETNGYTDTKLYLYDTDHTTQLAYDDDGGSDFFSKIVYDLPAVSINSFKFEKSIKIYPNPTSNKINILFEDKSINLINISLLNTQSQVISTIEKDKLDTDNLQLDLSEYSNGIYYLKIETKKRTVARKISIMK